MKWINAEQQLTVTIFDEEHEEHLDKKMTVEEILDTYTNEGCPTIYSNPERKPEKCGDCISRQAVIDTIETDCSWDIFNEWGCRTPTGVRIINAIKSVPSVEPEKCGDCVSRQDVLDLAERGKLVSNGNYKSVCDAINALPSVEPERKPGKWIAKDGVYGITYCSECDYEMRLNDTNYCPNCGAKMEGSE